jgi:hypothetical protein
MESRIIRSPYSIPSIIAYVGSEIDSAIHFEKRNVYFSVRQTARELLDCFANILGKDHLLAIRIEAAKSSVAITAVGGDGEVD